ncbi:MAG: hypothetical protein JO078_00050 [Candidatus Eremiobacteraeota bacterium]|nr:hypothetical protein [Candidatus Eremiobacteraeota bacterium]
MKDSSFVFGFAVVLSTALLASCGGGQPGGQLPAAQAPSSFVAAAHGASSVHYRLVYMGTFGGPASEGTQINASGETAVVGWSATSFREPPHAHPLICGGSDNIIKFVTHAFEWRGGRIADFGSLGGPRYCSIESQNPPNAAGDFVGLSENGAIDPQTGFDQSRAVVFRNGRIYDLGSFGGNQNGGNQINDQGQSVGFSLNTVPDPYSFMDFIFLGSSVGTQTRAFLSEHGHMRDLGTLGTGNDAWAFFINRHGQVGGVSYTNTTPSPVFGFPTLDPFFWNGHRMIDLGTLGGTYSLPAAMNDRGEIVGQSYLADEATTHPFYWNGSKMIDVGTAGGSQGGAGAISDRGEVIGSTTTAGDKFDRGFVWKNGVRTDLPPLAGDCGSNAYAIDSQGRVFGNSTDCRCPLPFICDRHVVIWDRGTIINVGDLVDKGAPLRITAVGGASLAGPGIVNARGDIVGIGVPPGVPRYNDYRRGQPFLLIPER